MRTNLIQTYMNNTQPDRRLDIDYVLSNKTFIRPLPPKGHLVKSSIINSPATVSKDIAYDFNSLAKARKGKANDHELGKINDFGMKMGGLVIAGYLMTRKQTPLTKAMELVGLTSFFASMALWPKLALQLPARLIHGFDIRKEYEDSYGRKKMFFQDPQYIPWDLIDDERIQKIGDRMNVPKDIPNRREFIQGKMKKIATQNNTLWMLTAGFATPVMSALMCNLCEKPLNKYLDGKRSNKADKLLVDLGEKYKSYMDKSVPKDMEKIFAENKGKVINDELINKISEVFTRDVDGVTAISVKTDLKNLLSDKKFVVDKQLLDNLATKLHSSVPNSSLPSGDRLAELLKDSMNKGLTEGELNQVYYPIMVEIKKSLIKDGVEDLDGVLYKLEKEDIVSSTLKSKPHSVLDEGKIHKLNSLTKTLSDFKAKNAVLDEYIYLKAGAAPETTIANAFNDVTGSIVKILNISDKEITAVRHDRNLTGKLLREKLEAITSNDAEYQKVFRSLADKISQLDSKLQAIDTSANGGYEAMVNSIFDETAKNIRKDMPKTAESLIGKNGVENGSLKHIQLSYAKNRLLGVRSSLYRFMNTLDFYKRISTMENIPALHKNMPREVKEELVELCKNIALEGSTSDFMTKFYSLRNPHPDLTDLSNIEVQNGKVVNKYLGKTVKGGKVNMPNDKDFFKEIIRLLYENDMHPQTMEMLSDTVMSDGMRHYRREFARDVGDSLYFAKPYHLAHGTQSSASSYTKFLKVGMTPEQMLHKTIKETYNTRKWLKMFGGFGAGLLAVTVLAQFFFGKMKTPERIKND